MEDQKPYENKKGCECSHCQPVKNTFLNDIGHTHTCQCLECQELQEKPIQGCHNCENTTPGTGSCALSRDKEDRCQRSPARPFWRPILKYGGSETGHARTCRCDVCTEYWKKQKERNCTTCGKRINTKDLECPLEHDARQECARDFWSMWEPIKSFMGSPDWAKKQELKADQAVEFVRKAWTAKEDTGQYEEGDDDEDDIATDYRRESTVSSQKDRIKELVEAHWNYQEKLLTAGQDKKQTFTLDQVMEMRKWDYTSSAKHFYGHGYEDAKGEI